MDTIKIGSKEYVLSQHAAERVTGRHLGLHAIRSALIFGKSRRCRRGRRLIRLVTSHSAAYDEVLHLVLERDRRTVVTAFLRRKTPSLVSTNFVQLGQLWPMQAVTNRIF